MKMRRYKLKRAYLVLTLITGIGFVAACMNGGPNQLADKIDQYEDQYQPAAGKSDTVTIVPAQTEVAANEGSGLSCAESAAAIVKITAQPATCASDADCVFMPIACGMGCPIVNRIQQSQINQIIDKRTNCMCTMEACMPVEDYACIDGTCQRGIPEEE